MAMGKGRPELFFGSFVLKELGFKCMLKSNHRLIGRGLARETGYSQEVGTMV